MKEGNIKRNISYSFTSNVLGFVIAALVTFFVPRFIGVESYGYFQLYVFYSSYIGFLHFGWADGLYLRYGGEYYDRLDRHVISGQFWAMFTFELIVSVLACLIGIHIVAEENKAIVIAMTASTIALVLPRTLLQYVLQCTNRIREYAITAIAEKTVYFVLIIICLLLSIQAFEWFIAADIAGKLVSLIITCIYCKRVVFCRPDNISGIWAETWANISVGIKLMLSNIASMLVIGIVRYAIEVHWDIATFGKVSLTLSVSNMLVVMINAVALVMYPVLRRTDAGKYAELYKKISASMMIPVLAVLILYFPMKEILSLWLPRYSDSLVYMAILFPLCVFESKNSMVMITFFKTMRKETTMLVINLVTVLCSIIAVAITVYYLDSLNLAVFSIVILVAIRNIISEVAITRVLEINNTRRILEELVLVTVFIVANWFVGGVAGIAIYTLCYCVYLYINRNDLKTFMQLIKN